MFISRCQLAESETRRAGRGLARARAAMSWCYQPLEEVPLVDFFGALVTAEPLVLTAYQ